MADDTAADDLYDALLRAERLFLQRFKVGASMSLHPDGGLPDLVYMPGYAVYVQSRMGPHPIRLDEMSPGMAVTVAAALPELWKRCLARERLPTVSDIEGRLRAFVDEKARELADGPGGKP